MVENPFILNITACQPSTHRSDAQLSFLVSFVRSPVSPFNVRSIRAANGIALETYYYYNYY